MSEPGDMVARYVEELTRRKYARLEEEARVLLAMGYDPRELTIVAHDDGSSEVAPLSALGENP